MKCKDLSAQVGPEMCKSFILTVSEKKIKRQNWSLHSIYDSDWYCIEIAISKRDKLTFHSKPFVVI